MSTKMFPVVHFEMPAENTERARRFYADVFGWKITPLGPEMGDFALAYTTETDDETRMPRKLGAINGGFFKPTDSDRQTKITILVPEIRAAMAAVAESGGKVLGEPFDVPGVGLFVSFTDPEGNLVSLYEDRSPNPTPEQRRLLE